MKVLRSGRTFEFNMTQKKLNAFEKNHPRWWDACDGMTDWEAESYLRGLNQTQSPSAPIGWKRDEDNVVRFVYK